MKTVTIGLTNIHFHYSELKGIIGTAVLSSAPTEIQYTILLFRHNREVEQ